MAVTSIFTSALLTNIASKPMQVLAERLDMRGACSLGCAQARIVNIGPLVTRIVGLD